MRVREEVPLFCEELRLGAPWRWGGAIAVAGLIATGIASGGWGGSTVQWLSGLCLTLGSAGAVGLWRLSRFETTVSRYGVRAGCGDLGFTFARADVLAAEKQKARSWRAWFAPEEVLVRLSSPAGERQLAIPSRQPQDLMDALQEGL